MPWTLFLSIGYRQKMFLEHWNNINDSDNGNGNSNINCNIIIAIITNPIQRYIHTKQTNIYLLLFLLLPSYSSSSSVSSLCSVPPPSVLRLENLQVFPFAN